MIASLQAVVQDLAPVFTEPSFFSHCQLLLGWVMCLGRHTEYRVGQAVVADAEVSRGRRHPFDRFYNFFARSAWQVNDLARHAALSAVTRLKVLGPLYLVVADSLLHKRGLKVFGIGWFRDAVASTRQRVATASGTNWVALAVAVPIPWCPDRVFCSPLAMRLHLPGQDQPSCASLARAMLEEALTWFPGRDIILSADAAYACQGLLEGLPGRVTFVGRLRGDAAVYDPTVPPQPKGQRGPRPKKGPRLLSPREAARQADQSRSGQGPWAWPTVEALAYGVRRGLKALSYTALWPHVLGARALRLVVVRDPEGKFEDAYLFTTALTALPVWVIETFAKRWAIEQSFRDSKQVLDIQAPQHWCQRSIEKLAPWVWLLQGVLLVWYVSDGHTLPEAKEVESLMGPWDSPWSLRHMLQVLRRATLNATIPDNSPDCNELQHSIRVLKNLLNSAA
jgi:hypothetical protein